MKGTPPVVASKPGFIDPNNAADIAHWTKTLGISEQTLASAVKRVGHSSTAVLLELRRRRHSYRQA